MNSRYLRSSVGGIKKVVPIGVRRRLRRGLDESVVGAALSIYRREEAPLALVDAWRLARLLKDSDGRSAVVAIRPRALRGAEILLRRGTSDPHSAMQTFVYGLHVPPNELVSPRVVWDLGCNIGLTVAHYACLYPQARVVGVEPDPQNAVLARHNIEPWRGRCKIMECAVWDADGEVAFHSEAGNEFAGHIVDWGERLVRSYSLDTLLKDEHSVDLLKIDIEGAEQMVLQRNTTWASKVRNVIVEVHEPYTVCDCIRDLRRLGFSPTLNPSFGVSVVGTKDDA